MVKILEDVGSGKTLKYNNYSVSKECFDSSLNYIKARDLARGVYILRGSKENKMRIAGCMNPYLTINGIDYLNKYL